MNALRRIPAALCAALGLLITVPSVSFAAQDSKKEDSAKEKGADGEAEKDEEEEEEEEPDRWIAVTGGDIYTVTQGMVRAGTLLAKNGKIHRIGHDVEIPAEADTIDATGLRIYPGLIAMNSRSIVGNEPPEDNTDVFALNLTLALSTGITTTVTGNTAAKLTYGTLEGMVVKRGLFTNVNLRGAQAWNRFREDLEKIREHDRAVRDHELAKARGEESEEPKAQGLNGNYVKMLKGEVTARFSIDSSRDLRRLAKLAREYDFSGVLDGASEGWVVADDLGRAGFSAILSPRTTRQSNRASNLPNGRRIENASILHDHGVPVAVVPASTGISLNGLVGADLFTLPIEAAYAVRGGLSRDAALESITINAARILGIQEHVGSLEVGKDADFIVTDGDVLHYRTLVHYSVVNGRVAYDKANESLLSHIRPLDGEPRFKVAELIEELEEIHPADDGAKEGDESGGDGENAEAEKKTEGSGGEEKGEGGGGR